MKSTEINQFKMAELAKEMMDLDGDSIKSDLVSILYKSSIRRISKKNDECTFLSADELTSLKQLYDFVEKLEQLKN